MSTILKTPNLHEKVSYAYAYDFKTRMILKVCALQSAHGLPGTHSEPEELADSCFKIRGIKAHQGPLDPDHPDYKGSSYNLLVEWEMGEVTYGTLTKMSMDDPVSCAECSKKHNLLDKSRWKRL